MISHGLFQHYKGGTYKVLNVAKDEATQEPVVVYQNVENGDIWTRRFENFVETVDGQPRFRYLGEECQAIPKTGIGIMIWKDGKVLMGQRKGTHGAGEWAWPGGHFEYMEGFEECARREVFEEAGIEITNIRFLRLMNLKAYAPKHYVDIGLMADWESGEPHVKEPDKLIEWKWVDPEYLPSPMFHTLPSYFEALKTGKTFFDR